MTRTTKEALEAFVRKTGRPLPEFGPPGSRPCRTCGEPNDHVHFRYDEEFRRNVIVPEPEEWESKDPRLAPGV